MSDQALRVIDIDGDEFSECDYGLVVDNSNSTQELNNKLDLLAQAALQNQTLSFSTIMKLYGSSSLAEKQRSVERDEQSTQEQQSKAAQEEREMEEAKIQADAMMKERQLTIQEESNIRDNETKLLIAQMTKYADQETSEDIEYSPEKKEELAEKIRQFDLKLSLEKDKHELEKKKHKDDVVIKNKQLSKRPK